jgi:hypothetical protein
MMGISGKSRDINLHDLKFSIFFKSKEKMFREGIIVAQESLILALPSLHVKERYTWKSSRE